MADCAESVQFCNRFCDAVCIGEVHTPQTYWPYEIKIYLTGHINAQTVLDNTVQQILDD
jgi:Tfp pilus assembly ATPase PilU